MKSQIDKVEAAFKAFDAYWIWQYRPFKRRKRK